MRILDLKDRILHSRFRMLLIIFILFWPSFEILYHLKYIPMGAAIPNPDYAFFLTVNSAGIGHLFQSLWFWFMPFYLTMLFGELCMEEYRSGYVTVLYTKLGKKYYICSYIMQSMILGFILVAAALLFNFIMVHIMFAGGTGSPYSITEQGSAWYQLQHKYATGTNLIFTCITAVIISILTGACTAIAILIKNRKLVYGINVIIWMLFVVKENSVVLLFQPFSEYSLKTLLHIGGGFILCYGLLIMIAYIVEVKKKE